MASSHFEYPNNYTPHITMPDILKNAGPVDAGHPKPLAAERWADRCHVYKASQTEWQWQMVSIQNAAAVQQVTPTPCSKYFNPKRVFHVASALRVAYAGTESHRNVLRGQIHGLA